MGIYFLTPFCTSDRRLQQYTKIAIIKNMIFPLKELIEFKGNIYEITCAATRRAFQLVTIQDSILKENNDKVVCTAASQVFTGDIDYKIEYHPDYS